MIRKPRKSIRAGTAQLTNSFANDQWLLQPDTLRKWAHLTLLQRCAKIEVRFRVKRAHRTLAALYRRNNIGYRRTHMGFRSEVTDETLVGKRREFALKLQGYIAKGIPIIYGDESSFNCWQRKE